MPPKPLLWVAPSLAQQTQQQIMPAPGAWGACPCHQRTSRLRVGSPQSPPQIAWEVLQLADKLHLREVEAITIYAKAMILLGNNNGDGGNDGMDLDGRSGLSEGE